MPYDVNPYINLARRGRGQQLYQRAQQLAEREQSIKDAKDIELAKLAFGARESELDRVAREREMKAQREYQTGRDVAGYDFQREMEQSRQGFQRENMTEAERKQAKNFFMEQRQQAIDKIWPRLSTKQQGEMIDLFNQLSNAQLAKADGSILEPEYQSAMKIIDGKMASILENPSPQPSKEKKPRAEIDETTKAVSGWWTGPEDDPKFTPNPAYKINVDRQIADEKNAIAKTKAESAKAKESDKAESEYYEVIRESDKYAKEIYDSLVDDYVIENEEPPSSGTRAKLKAQARKRADFMYKGTLGLAYSALSDEAKARISSEYQPPSTVQPKKTSDEITVPPVTKQPEATPGFNGGSQYGDLLLRGKGGGEQINPVLPPNYKPDESSMIEVGKPQPIPAPVAPEGVIKEQKPQIDLTERRPELPNGLPDTSQPLQPKQGESLTSWMGREQALREDEAMGYKLKTGLETDTEMNLDDVRSYVKSIEPKIKDDMLTADPEKFKSSINLVAENTAQMEKMGFPEYEIARHFQTIYDHFKQNTLMKYSLNEKTAQKLANIANKYAYYLEEK